MCWMLRSIRSLRQKPSVRRSYAGISTTSTAMLKVSHHHHLFSQSFGGQEKIPTHRHITYAYHAQNKVRQSLASGLLRGREFAAKIHIHGRYKYDSLQPRCLEFVLGSTSRAFRVEIEVVLVARPCMAFLHTTLSVRSSTCTDTRLAGKGTQSTLHYVAT